MKTNAKLIAGAVLFSVLSACAGSSTTENHTSKLASSDIEDKGKMMKYRGINVPGRSMKMFCEYEDPKGHSVLVPRSNLNNNCPMTLTVK